MLRGILIAVLAIGVIGTGYWGYKEHQEKNAVLIQAENSYQRAFHDLTYEVDLLHDKIGTTLAMNSRTSLSPALAEVWRITSEAQINVGQLPLTLLPFNKTEEFLSNIGQFSYQTAVRDLEKEPLSDEEYKTLQSLYEHAGEIQKELRSVQHMVIENNLRWMDVEMALASGEKQGDNTIIDGFETVEKTVGSYAESDFGPTFTSLQKEDQGFKNLEGKQISAEEAKEKAKSFLNLEGNPKIRLTENGDGADNKFYSLEINDKDADIYMDITKKGGFPIWVLQNREIKEQNVSLNDGAIRAKKFLKEHNFKDLELYESAQYDHVGVFTYVSVKDGVRIYPDAIDMKVALDDGNVIGFSARDYLASNHERNIPKPKITVEEARGKINKNVEIMETRQAVILNDFGKEVLCHEFVGTINEDTYRIFINAETGMEEDVMKLKNAEPVFQSL